MALLCPHCNAATSFVPYEIRGKGINFDDSRDDRIIYAMVGISAVAEADKYPSIAILVCQNCKRLLVATRRGFQEWQAAWPLANVSVSDDVPVIVRSAVVEAKKSFAVEAYGACLLMSRTALIRLQRDRKVSTFKELADKGELSGSLYGQADEVRLWANVVGHDDFDSDKVGKEAAEELLVYLDAILDAVYIQPARLARARAQRGQLRE